MARKIPVEQAIGGAYGFFFSNLISIIGIVWFPIVLFGGLAFAAIWFGVLSHPLPAMPMDDNGHFDPERMRALIAAVGPSILAVYVCAIAGALMIVIGLMRKALGLMEGTTFFFFDLGITFWRLVAAIFLFALIVIALNIGFRLIVHVGMMAATPRVPHGIAMLVQVLGRLLFAAISIYVALRLVFFLPAVVVAEDRIGLGRAWQLGGGNFWRMVAVLVVVLLPAIIVFGIVFNVFVFTSLAGGFPMPPFARGSHPDPHETLVYAHRVMAFLFQSLKRGWPILLPLAVLYSVTLRSLFAGAVAAAYRGVTAEEQTSAESPH